MTQKLNFCPFCGHTFDGTTAESNIYAAFGDGEAPYCACCPLCAAEGPTGDSLDEAIAKWNTRAMSGLELVHQHSGEMPAVTVSSSGDGVVIDGKEISHW